MSEVKYTYIEHWIPKQAEAEKAMLAEFEAGNYTLENPLVKYNPYFINPLAAVVLFKTEKEADDELYRRERVKEKRQRLKEYEELLNEKLNLEGHFIVK